MIHGKAQGPLRFIIADDLYLGGVPPTAPSVYMRLGESRHPSLLDCRDMSFRRIGWVCNLTRAIGGNQSIQAERLAAVRVPRPAHLIGLALLTQIHRLELWLQT